MAIGIGFHRWENDVKKVRKDMKNIKPQLVLRNSEKVELISAWDINSDEYENIHSKNIRDEIINLLFDSIREAVKKTDIRIEDIESIEFRKE